MKTIHILSIFLIIGLTANSAQAMDVFGNDSFYIKVTHSKDGMFSKFELCPLKPKPGAENSGCDALGWKGEDGLARFYPVIQLKDQRSTEQWQVVGSWVGDIGGAALLVYGGVVIGVASSVVGSADWAVIAAGLVFGGPTTIAITGNFWDPMNPIEQQRQARMLYDDVITDKKVVLDSDVADYAYSLDTVLKKLDPVKTK